MTARYQILHMAHIRWFNAEVQYALDLAGETQRRGHRVVFWGQRGSPGVERARDMGLEVFADSGFNRKGLASVTGLSCALRLRNLLQRRRFDVVETHRGEGFPLVAWACFAAGVPLVRVRGDMRPLRADPLNRLLHHHWLAGFVATNSAIEVSCRERMGELPMLTTIHGGVDPVCFSPDGPRNEVRERLGFPPDAFLLGIVGRLGRVKGHHVLLSAVEKANAAGAEVYLVVLAKESTAAEAQLREQAAASRVLAARVGFLGHQADLAATLRAFDLGVVASNGSEANCRVGLEWMACGVPLLATRVGVLPDIVLDGRSGWLVPPDCPDALAQRIIQAYASREEVRDMGQLARERVETRFTVEHCARAHEDLISRVLG